MTLIAFAPGLAWAFHCVNFKTISGCDKCAGGPGAAKAAARENGLRIEMREMVWGALQKTPSLHKRSRIKWIDGGWGKK